MPTKDSYHYEGALENDRQRDSARDANSVSSNFLKPLDWHLNAEKRADTSQVS